MGNVVSLKNIPGNSIIGISFGKKDYSDTFKVRVKNPENLSVDHIITKFFSSTPDWVNVLLGIRDSIVKVFGLKTGKDLNQIEIDKNKVYKPGEKAVFFTVHSRNDNEVVLAEDDKHLNFRTSIMIEMEGSGNLTNVYCSTIVKYNNVGGSLYFTPVKPFHKAIIKTMLRILADDMDK